MPDNHFAPETRITPSTCLMSAMDGIDDCLDLLIIKVNAEGSIEWHSTTDSVHRRLGMVDFVRECIVESIHQWRKNEDGD
jgi:hypothetical protein